MDTLLGHSSVALELNRGIEDKTYKTRTYDAPVIRFVAPIFGLDKPTEQHKRFRQTSDIVCSLDNAVINYNTNFLSPKKNQDIDELY